MESEPRALWSRPLSRRAFLRGTFCTLAFLSVPAPLRASLAAGVKQGYLNPQPALYYQPLADKVVRCLLCPRQCQVRDGGRGDCGVRENRGGRYYTLVFGNPCAVHVDPVEKKPFFHVLPGSASYSIATAGCNLRCKFCQNWEISQALPEETYNYELPPAEVVQEAKKSNSASIAHTYVEPVIFYEYMLAVGQLAKQAGILNVCHTAAYVNPEPLEQLTTVLDAACVDLKAFTSHFYRQLVDGELEPVLKALELLRKRGVHVEIVNLVIPQHNDRPEEIQAMCEWIRDQLGPLTPLHFTRFYPMHKMLQVPPTPAGTLHQAREIALKAGLKYVYIGNLPGNPAENTYCHHCGKEIIGRRGYFIRGVALQEGKCGHCGAPIPGIWSLPRAA